MNRWCGLFLLTSLAVVACKTEQGVPPSTQSEGRSSSPTSAAGTASSAAPAPASRARADVLQGASGEIRITPIQHATFLLEASGHAIYFDPVKGAHYDGLPKAQIVFITDTHPDHLDLAGLEAVRQPSTIIVAPAAVAESLPKTLSNVTVLRNGEKKTLRTDAADKWSVEVEAVPMYNVTRGPSAGKLFHDKGRGDGFILTVDGKRIYVSGDTECIPEMKALKNIDVAFVCMNLPYTMPPAEAAECVNAFKPKIVYPYHYRKSDLGEFTKAIPKDSGVEVRLRDWYAE